MRQLQHLVIQLYLEKIVADGIEPPPPLTSSSTTSSTASLTPDTDALTAPPASARMTARRGSVSSGGGGVGLALPDFVLQAFFSRYGLKSLAEAQMVGLRRRQDGMRLLLFCAELLLCVCVYHMYMCMSVSFQG